MRRVGIAVVAALVAACGGSSSGGDTAAGSGAAGTGGASSAGAGGTGAGTAGAAGSTGGTSSNAGSGGSAGGPSGGGGSGGAACIDTGMSPAGLSEAMSIVDEKRKRLVFFGGDDGLPKMCNPSPHVIGDLWTYDLACKQFTQAMPASGPGPRARGSAAYDAKGDRMLAFGGRVSAGTGTYTLYDEVWSLDLAKLEWTKLSPTGPGPSARTNAVVAVDPLANDLVLFGGNTSTNGASFAPQADVWVLHLDSLTWEKKTQTGAAPKSRLFHSGALDPKTGRFFVYGGGGANAFTGPFYGDLWSLSPDRTAWTQVAAEGSGPGNRIWSTLAFDPGAGAVVLFGGHDDGAVGNQNDTWTIADGQAKWTQVVPPETLKSKPAGFCAFPVDFTTPNTTAPDRRSAQVAGFDGTSRTLHVFGGKTDCGLVNDTWRFDAAAGTWTRDIKATAGEACVRGDNPAQCTSLCN